MQKQSVLYIYIYIFVFILLVYIFTLEGTRDRKLATAACLQAMCDINVWAWEGMPVKLGRWAWLATGYVSLAEMAAFWHIGVSKSGLSPDRKYIYIYIYIFKSAWPRATICVLGAKPAPLGDNSYNKI